MAAAALRIAFLGNDRWSVPSLRALAASRHEIAIVATAPPRPAGRGNRPRRTAVADAAVGLDLPLVEVPTVRAGDGLARLVETRPDVMTVVAYGELLPPAVLSLPRIAPVNLHFSLLPELRGAAPVQTALLLGAERTGVTTFVMVEAMDAGPVLLQREALVMPEDDAGSLGARLAELGAGALVETVELLASGAAEPRPQDHARATFAPKLGRRDRELDWTRPAARLVDLCRALSPEPAATTTFRGRGLKVFRGRTVEVEGEPGRIAAVGADGIVVATASGGFRPVDLAPAGRRRMSGADFVNGFRPEVGERLG